MKILIVSIFIIYSSFSIILSLKVGKLKKEEKEKQSLAFKFMVIYGTLMSIMIPIFCLIYIILLFIK